VVKREKHIKREKCIKGGKLKTISIVNIKKCKGKNIKFKCFDIFLFKCV
jgi:hypothetical protein